MKFHLVNIGKTNDNFINQGVDKFVQRIKHYIPVEIHDLEIPKKTVKSLNIEKLKRHEGEQILKFCKNINYIILLDEKGIEYNSEQFAGFIQQKLNISIKTLAFVTGGSYGFSEDIYRIADERISLSKMTFSHQIIRLIFVEQLYRAFTIIKGEPYHHK